MGDSEERLGAFLEEKLGESEFRELLHESTERAEGPDIPDSHFLFLATRVADRTANALLQVPASCKNKENVKKLNADATELRIDMEFLHGLQNPEVSGERIIAEWRLSLPGLVERAADVLAEYGIPSFAANLETWKKQENAEELRQLQGHRDASAIQISHTIGELSELPSAREHHWNLSMWDDPSWRIKVLNRLTKRFRELSQDHDGLFIYMRKFVIRLAGACFKGDMALCCEALGVTEEEILHEAYFADYDRTYLQRGHELRRIIDSFLRSEMEQARENLNTASKKLGAQYGILKGGLN